MIRNIDEILAGYIRIVIRLKELISDKAKGDWSKLGLLVENDGEARRLYDQISQYEDEFRESTSLGNVFIFSEQLESIFEALGETCLNHEDKPSLEYELEDARNMIADLTHEDDYRVIALDNLARLPNYNPDDWIRRKYMIRGIYLGQGARIPAHLIRRIEEACCSFIYGNFLACVALARATTETALKEKYKVLFDGKKITLGKLIEKCCDIKEFKDSPRILNMVRHIKDAGDQIMHVPKNKIVHLINELKAKSVIHNMKEVIEFLYR